MGIFYKIMCRMLKYIFLFFRFKGEKGKVLLGIFYKVLRGLVRGWYRVWGGLVYRFRC